jgi:hypothetical protein
MGRLMDILSGAGAAFDLPGSTVRDIAGGRNPFDQWMTPFSWDNRLTGRDLLRQYGLASEEDTGLNAAGGVATEMALDPLAWTGAGALYKALSGGAKAARAARSAAPLAKAVQSSVKPMTAMSIASPVAGAYLIGDNMQAPPEDQNAWKNWMGIGLMAAPLVLGMARGVARPVEELLQIPLDQLSKPQRKRLNDLARRSDANPAVTKRVAEMWARDIRTKPQDLMTEAEKAAAQAAFRATGATGGRPTGSRLGDEVFRERLPKLEAEYDSLKRVQPKTLSAAERTAMDRRMHQLRTEISQARRRLVEPSPAQQTTLAAPTAYAPGPQPATPRKLSDLLTGKVPETPTRPPAPGTAYPPGTRLVTAADAVTEHYGHMDGYIRKTLRNNNYQGDIDEAAQEIVSRTWQSLTNKMGEAPAIPAGEEGWGVVKSFAINRIREHLKLTERGHKPRHALGSPGTHSKTDAYKMQRREFTEGVSPDRYDQEIGRMATMEDPAYHRMRGRMSPQEAELLTPQMWDILQDVSKGDPKYQQIAEAFAELAEELPTSPKGVPRKALQQRLAEKGVGTWMGVPGTRTILNWQNELIKRLREMGMDPDNIGKLMTSILAALGLGGASGGAVSRILTGQQGNAQHSGPITPAA